jgi:hypothetical protein
LSETQNWPLGQPAAGQPAGVLPALPPVPLVLLPPLPDVLPPVPLVLLPPLPDVLPPMPPPGGMLPPKPPCPATGLSSSSSSPHAETNAAHSSKQQAPTAKQLNGFRITHSPAQELQRATRGTARAWTNDPQRGLSHQAAEV